MARSRPRRSIARRGKAFGALLLLGLIFPASALAHTPTAQVSCTGADFNWTIFAAGQNTVHYLVTVDGVTVQQGTTVLAADGGRSGSLHVPLSLNDTHTVAAFSWWDAADTVDGNSRPANSPALDEQTLVCPAATPPPVTPPPTTVTPPAPVTPAPQTVPAAQGVAGVQARAATARVAAQSSCARRTVRIVVSGRQIRRVTFSVAGRRIRTVNVRANQRRLTVNLPVRSFGARRQRVQARVTFRNGAPARTLTTSATRCAQAAVQPQFTG